MEFVPGKPLGLRFCGDDDVAPLPLLCLTFSTFLFLIFLPHLAHSFSSSQGKMVIKTDMCSFSEYRVRKGSGSGQEEGKE